MIEMDDNPAMISHELWKDSMKIARIISPFGYRYVRPRQSIVI